MSTARGRDRLQIVLELLPRLHDRVAPAEEPVGRVLLPGGAAASAAVGANGEKYPAPRWPSYFKTPKSVDELMPAARLLVRNQSGLQGKGMANAGPDLATQMKDRLVEEARLLEASGAALLDFTNSGPEAGAAAAQAVSIPVIGGLGGGPWLDGRVRMGYAAIGYLAAALDDEVERYASVARTALDAFKAFADDVRGGRQIKGAPRPKA